jgi:replication factor C subunit 2/4
MTDTAVAASVPSEANKENSVAKAKKSMAGYQVPWVEKYRPRVLEDVVGNEETVSRLRAISRTGNLPNLILAGPPGTGKTTSVHALARQLLGASYKDAVLELNASDARGIDVVRNRIKSFAMNKVTLPPGRHKIIILDEADSMTSAAQQALRRTMELYSNTTRFCLACNVSTKIIEAIQSRAAILRYSRLANEQVLTCLLKVCQAESISYTNDALEAILFTAEGDMRHALNNLQASYFLTNGIITQTSVFKVCDQPHPKTVGQIISHCTKGDTKAACDQMQALWKSGYSTNDIIGTVFKVVKAHGELPEALKLEYLREIGFTQMRISDGVNSPLQLLGLLARLAQKMQQT